MAEQKEPEMTREELCQRYMEIYEVPEVKEPEMTKDQVDVTEKLRQVKLQTDAINHEITARLHELDMGVDFSVMEILCTPMTMIYTPKDDKFLADKMVKKTEEETGKVLSEEEKERIWKLVVGAATG